jgi:CubicO group peptidase (beta-lactamase class C family)
MSRFGIDGVSAPPVRILFRRGQAIERAMRTLLIALALLALPFPARATPFSLGAIETEIASGKYGKIRSVLIEQHGKTIYQRAFAKAGEPSLHDIRSAGKSITALAVGLAIADGKLSSVDAAVWPLLGSAKNDPHNGITVRDLLTMSSALECNDGDRKSPGQEEKMYRQKDWRAFAMKLPLASTYARDSKGYGRWSYCSAGVFLLGQVVEKAVSERFDLYVQRRLFDPLGIKQVEWRRSPTGEVQSGGQLKIGAADLAKIGRTVLDRGRWQGQQILPESWVQEMLQPHRQVGTHIHYGYLWWFSPVNAPGGHQPSWLMQGNGGNMVAIFRGYDAVVVVQSANYNQPDADAQSNRIIEAALAALPPPLAKP